MCTGRPTGRLTRRAFVAAACAGAAGARAAFDADGPARLRAGAVRSVLLDLAAAGSRLVAVGERGHVLLSDDRGATWRQARGVPTRSTLTSVYAADEKVLWATAHGGIILRSGDAGETWSIAAGRADGPDVLMSIRLTPEGHGLAVGGFGVALATADGGATWKEARLLDGEAGEKHLNRIVVSAAGTWLIAAEGGMVVRAEGGGPAVAATKWNAVQAPYKGSLWTGMPLRDGTLLMGGMRGNIVKSGDDGRTFVHQPVAQAGSFTGCTLLADGRPVLVGVDGTVVVGDAAAQQFTLHRQDDRATLTAAVALADRGLVLATLSGMRVIEVPT